MKEKYILLIIGILSIVSMASSVCYANIIETNKGVNDTSDIQFREGYFRELYNTNKDNFLEIAKGYMSSAKSVDDYISRSYKILSDFYQIQWKNDDFLFAKLNKIFSYSYENLIKFNPSIEDILKYMKVHSINKFPIWGDGVHQFVNNAKNSGEILTLFRVMTQDTFDFGQSERLYRNSSDVANETSRFIKPFLERFIHLKPTVKELNEFNSYFFDYSVRVRNMEAYLPLVKNPNDFIELLYVGYRGDFNVPDVYKAPFEFIKKNLVHFILLEPKIEDFIKLYKALYNLNAGYQKIPTFTHGFAYYDRPALWPIKVLLVKSIAQAINSISNDTSKIQSIIKLGAEWNNIVFPEGKSKGVNVEIILQDLREMSVEMKNYRERYFINQLKTLFDSRQIETILTPQSSSLGESIYAPKCSNLFVKVL